MVPLLDRKPDALTLGGIEIAIDDIEVELAAAAIAGEGLSV